VAKLWRNVCGVTLRSASALAVKGASSMLRLGDGQNRGIRAIASDRKRVEMLFAHLKRIPRLGRLRLRGPRGAQFEFTLAGIAQNLRRLAKLTILNIPRPLCQAI
jgi:hypothetical protein